MATTRVCMKRPERTTLPVRVTSETSTVPRDVETSTLRPALAERFEAFRLRRWEQASAAVRKVLEKHPKKTNAVLHVTC